MLLRSRCGYNVLTEAFWEQSEQEFTQAFYNCHVDAKRNQGSVFSHSLSSPGPLTLSNHRRILTYLIPLRILRGHLPTRALLDKFPILDDLFAPFLAAIQSGDISAYDKALEKEERRLVELNLLLTLERGRELCVRGLFRRVYVPSLTSFIFPLVLTHTSEQMGRNRKIHSHTDCVVPHRPTGSRHGRPRRRSGVPCSEHDLPRLHPRLHRAPATDGGDRSEQRVSAHRGVSGAVCYFVADRNVLCLIAVSVPIL